MKRKAISILLLLLMIMTTVSAPAESKMSEKEKVAHLKEIVQGYLDSEELHYSYDEEQEIFDMRYSLECTLSSCDVRLVLYDDMLSVTAGPSLRVPEKNKDATSIYLTLVNNNCYYAQFRMDYQSGSLVCRAAQVIEQVFPTADEVDTLLNSTLYTLDKYGDGLNKVAQLGYDPHQAFKECIEEEKPANNL